MAESKEMIFISWSTQLAMRVAVGLSDLIHLATDRVHAFVSDSDIESGQRPMDVITNSLHASNVAIIIVTPDNYGRPWLNYEAGAISNALGAPRVIPLLVGMTPAQLPGSSPLSQYQARQLNPEGLNRLMDDIASLVQLDPAVLRSRIESKIPEFLRLVRKATEAHAGGQAAKVSDRDILEELLMTVRALPPTVRGRRASSLSPHSLAKALRAMAECKVALGDVYDQCALDPNGPAIEVVVTRDLTEASRDQVFSIADRFGFKLRILQLVKKQEPNGDVRLLIEDRTDLDLVLDSGLASALESLTEELKAED